MVEFIVDVISTKLNISLVARLILRWTILKLGEMVKKSIQNGRIMDFAIAAR